MSLCPTKNFNSLISGGACHLIVGHTCAAALFSSQHGASAVGSSPHTRNKEPHEQTGQEITDRVRIGTVGADHRPSIARTWIRLLRVKQILALFPSQRGADQPVGFEIHGNTPLSIRSVGEGVGSAHMKRKKNGN